MVSKYRSVLSLPGASRLFASALVARLPQGMSSLAILLLVRSTTHSYAAAGVAVGGFALATAACAPLLGRLVDHFGRARVLLPFACGQACVYVLLVVAAQAGAGVVVLVVLSSLCGALLPPIAPAVRALLREVFDDQAVLDTAYALESILQETVWIAGPLLVALVIAVTSPEVAVAMLGAVCIVGTSLFLRSPLVRSSSTSLRLRPRARVGARQPRVARAARSGGADRSGARGGRGRTAVARPPRRVPAGVGSAARAVEPREHGRRSLVRRARVALVAGDALPAAARRAPGVHGAADRGAFDRRRRRVQPARRTRDRAGVLVPVRARRPFGDGGQRDRGVHVGVRGADRRARRRLGGRRRGDRAGGRRGSVRVLVPGLAAGGA